MSKYVELVTQYAKAVDEQFSAESYTTDQVTNQDYDWDGAKTVKVYKVGTAPMYDYARDEVPSAKRHSLYGELDTLDAITETMTLKNDKSFTYVLDSMDVNETGQSLEAAESLARQTREVIIPMCDSYTFGVMCENAGNTSTVKLDSTNIYDEILKGTEILDDNMVPNTERKIVVSPYAYKLLKESGYLLHCDVSMDMRLKGVVDVIDGMPIIRVPSRFLPDSVEMIICHPCATINPKKLAEFGTHNNPPFISGFLCEGRIYYDTFVLNNKKNAIYVVKNSDVSRKPSANITGDLTNGFVVNYTHLGSNTPKIVVTKKAGESIAESEYTVIGRNPVSVAIPYDIDASTNQPIYKLEKGDYTIHARLESDETDLSTQDFKIVEVSE